LKSLGLLIWIQTNNWPHSLSKYRRWDWNLKGRIRILISCKEGKLMKLMIKLAKFKTERETSSSDNVSLITMAKIFPLNTSKTIYFRSKGRRIKLLKKKIHKILQNK
jgi:hypothetical protein